MNKDPLEDTQNTKHDQIPDEKWAPNQAPETAHGLSADLGRRNGPDEKNLSVHDIGCYHHLCAEGLLRTRSELAVGRLAGSHTIITLAAATNKKWRRPASSLTMAFMLIRQADRHWHRLNGSNVIVHVLEGKKFQDGVMVQASAA